MLEDENVRKKLHDELKPQVDGATRRVYLQKALEMLNRFGSYRALAADRDNSEFFDLLCGAGGLVVDWNSDGSLQVDESQRHNLVIGGTGTGKTRRCALASLMSMILAGQNVMATDSKGELLRECRGLLDAMGYEVHVVDFRNPSASDRYNLMGAAWDAWNHGRCDDARLLLQDLAENIVPSDSDAFWHIEAARCVAAFAEGMLEYGVDHAEFSLHSVAMMESLGSQKDGPTTVLTEFFTNVLGKDSLAAIGAVGLNNAPNETRASILSFLHSGLAPLNSLEGLIEIASTESDFQASDLARRERVAVFLLCPDTTTAFMPTVAALLNQVLCELKRIADDEYEGALPQRVNVLLEEFGNIESPVDGLARTIATCRSRNIRITMMLQSVMQLDKVYGESERRSVLSNMLNVVYLGCQDYDFVDDFSKKCGTNAEGKPVLGVRDLRRLHVGERGSEAVVVLNSVGPFVTELKDVSVFGTLSLASKDSEDAASEKGQRTFERRFFNIKSVVDEHREARIRQMLGGDASPHQTRVEAGGVRKSTVAEDLIKRIDVRIAELEAQESAAAD